MARQLTCPKCGAKVAATDMICGTCGYLVMAPAAAQAERAVIAARSVGVARKGASDDVVDSPPDAPGLDRVPTAPSAPTAVSPPPAQVSLGSTTLGSMIVPVELADTGAADRMGTAPQVDEMTIGSGRAVAPATAYALAPAYASTPPTMYARTDLSRRRLRQNRLVPGVVVLALVLLVVAAWQVIAHPVTAPSRSDSGAPAATSSDLRSLRHMLDRLLAINSGLPLRVSIPQPLAAEKARTVGKALRAWRRSYALQPDAAALAGAGIRFADALRLWLLHPNRVAAHQAYLKAWKAWDAVDPTWTAK